MIVKEKDRTSVEFQVKTTKSQNFEPKLPTAKLDSPDHNS